MVTLYSRGKAPPRGIPLRCTCTPLPPFHSSGSWRVALSRIGMRTTLLLVGKIADLRVWWDKLSTEGPGFGYFNFTNPSKTWLVTKQGFLASATSSFAGTVVKVTPEGRPYLGAAIGSQEFVETHVKSKITSWVSCVNCLSDIARIQPHAAFSAPTHGLISKWTYLSRTTTQYQLPDDTN